MTKLLPNKPESWRRKARGSARKLRYTERARNSILLTMRKRSRWLNRTNIDLYVAFVIIFFIFIMYAFLIDSLLSSSTL